MYDIKSVQINDRGIQIMQKGNTSLRTKILLYLSVAGINILLDQITKIIVRKTMYIGERINIIGSFFTLQHSTNRGAFLGMGDNLPDILRIILLNVIPLILIVLLSIYIFRHKKIRIFELVCFSTIIGGGLSNLVDRIFSNGYVTDFLHFYITRYIQTGVLNVADMSVTFGALVLLILYGVYSKKEKKEKEEPSAE